MKIKRKNRLKKTAPKHKIKAKVSPRAKKHKAHLPKIVRLVSLAGLKPPAGARRKKKLLGRGPGSGHGKTSTRGNKGQTSRTGRHFYLGFEGGQVPLVRKIPKRGFSNLSFKKTYQIVNLKELLKIKKALIDPDSLSDCGLIRNKEDPVKILGEGEIEGPLTVRAHAFSKKAKEKIEKSGGKIEVINA